MVVFPMTTGDVDQWAWTEIGQPFPENPCRVKGDTNQYPALWYKNGKPIFGRAWNNGGVVECSFAWNGKELTGARDLGGKIQILTYKGTIDDNKFEYKWVPWKERNGETYALVKCGKATGLLAEAMGEKLFGNLDLSSEVLEVAKEGKCEKKSGGLTNLLCIVREHFKPDPPPPGKPKVPVLVHPKEDQWKDIRIHDPAPENMVMAGGKKISCADGRLHEVYVALWYKNGEPVFGRCWGYKGEKIEASFGILGKEFTGAIGSIQVLQYTNPDDLVFEIKWVPYKDCVGGGKEWKPVQVKDAAPCLIKDSSGAEKLGCVWMLKGKASASEKGVELDYTGACVQEFLVLCRKDLPPKTIYI